MKYKVGDWVKIRSDIIGTITVMHREDYVDVQVTQDGSMSVSTDDLSPLMVHELVDAIIKRLGMA